MKTLVIIPTKNAYDNILQTIELVDSLSNDIEYLVIDYGSKDNSKYLLVNNEIRHINFPIEGTYGGAISLGLMFAKQKKYDAVIEWNQDGRFDIENIKYLIRTYQAQDVDMVLASRFQWKKASFWNLKRKNLSRTIKMMTNKKVTDPDLKLKLLGKEAYTALVDLKYLYSGPDAICHLLKAKYSFTEIDAKVNTNIKRTIDKGIMYVFQNMLLMMFSNPIRKKGK